jgi:SAM-dependent methyltransferase
LSLTGSWEHKAQLVRIVSDGAERVLDVGCGPRRYREFCGRCEYVGVDVLGRPDVLGSASHLPFKDGAFGAVIAMDVLEHVDGIESAAFECLRVLKTGEDVAGDPQRPRPRDLRQLR